MSRSDGLDAYENKLARRARGKYVTMTADTKEIDRFIKAISGDKEGRKVTRNAAIAALELFNIETGKEAADLNLKKSGKGWRKTLSKLSAYKTKASAKSDGSFKAKTGINYKKAVLRVSHLVERGFQHFRAGKVPGNWFRQQAYDKNRDKVMSNFMRNLTWGWGQVAKTGKAPTFSKIRKRFQ